MSPQDETVAALLAAAIIDTIRLNSRINDLPRKRHAPPSRTSSQKPPTQERDDG